MTELITDLQALDIDAHLTAEGPAILSLITNQGRVSIHMQRRVFDALAARMKREQSRGSEQFAPPKVD